MKLSTFIAPLVVDSWEVVKRSLAQIERDLKEATRTGWDPALRTASFTASVGAFHRVSPQRGGLSVQLPRALADNGARQIKLSVEHPQGALTVLAPSGQSIDDGVKRTFTRAGLVTLESNGFDRWFTVGLSIETVTSSVSGVVSSGPPGNDGEPGPPGDPGPAGRDGAQGPQGLAGQPGPPGNDGQDGRDGEDGLSGAPGATGPAGAPGAGAQGNQGPPGNDGEPGERGEAGSTGPQGPSGVQGAQGFSGQGPPGNDGQDGRDGEPGPAGPAGPSGAPGAQGLGTPGPPGNDGEQGPEGPPGVKGDTGAAGADARYNSSQSTTGNAAQINFARSSSSVNKILVTPTGTSEGFTGIDSTGVVDGQLLWIINVDATFNVEIFHENAASTAANRIQCPDAASLVLRQLQSATLCYSSSLSRWQVISVSRSNIGHNANLAIQTNGNLSLGSGLTTQTVTIAAGASSGAFNAISGAAVTIGTTAISPTFGNVDVSASGVSLTATSDISVSRGVRQILNTPTIATPTGAIVLFNDGNQPRYRDQRGSDWSKPHSTVARLPNAGLVQVSAATTALQIAGSSFSIPANSLQVGSTYRLTGHLHFVRGATATAMNISANVQVGGAASATTGAITTATAATTGVAWFEAFVYVVTTGAAGTYQVSLRAWEAGIRVAGSTAVTNISWAAFNTFAINTTTANTIELVGSMSAAVAGTSITAVGGCIERIAVN